MEEPKTKNEESPRWVVATDEELEEAKKKGLFKGLISMAAKKEFKLSSGHISDLVWMVGDAIEKRVHDWRQRGGEVDDPENMYFIDLESLLYILEDLLPYHYFGQGDGFRVGDNKLFRQINLIRKKIAFPLQVEAYYSAYLKKEDEYYLRSSICDLCGERGANCSYSNSLMLHENCPAKYGFYKCEWCGWLYPSNKQRCERKGECKKKELVKCKHGDEIL